MSDSAQEFSSFVVASERRLLGIAYLLTGDRGHAEDLLQTALAATYRRWARVSTTENPMAYVRTAMVHTAISWRRRRMSTERVVDRFPDVPVEDAQTSSAAADEMRRALMRLSPRVRAVLVLRFYADLTERETARILGCSVSSVSTHTARGLAALRTSLSAGGEPPVPVPQEGRS